MGTQRQTEIFQAMERPGFYPDPVAAVEVRAVRRGVDESEHGVRRSTRGRLVHFGHRATDGLHPHLDVAPLQSAHAPPVPRRVSNAQASFVSPVPESFA